ncbi:MAG: hypothetical protein P1P64_05910 [Treponemataceae bacterium]
MNYFDEITVAIENARENLESYVFPKLIAEFSLQRTVLGGFLNLLTTKRLIHSNPYTYDSKMTEIDLPETAPFADAEKTSIVGTRFTHYVKMIEFVTNYYQFNCEYLTAKRLSSLVKLTQVFTWDDFSITSKSPNTAALASILESVKDSVDYITSDVIRNTISQMEKSTITIKPLLERVFLYQREAYKLFIRKSVIPLLPPKLIANFEDTEPIFSSVKKILAKNHRNTPFYKDLITEILNEDYDPSYENTKLDILKRLQQNITPSQKKEAPKIDYHQTLMTGLRVLANSVSQFEVALEKVLFNEELITKGSKTFFSRILDVFRAAFNIKKPEKEIIVMIEDSITQSKKREVVNLNDFKAAVSRKISVFNTLISNAPQISQKLRQIPEKALFENFSTYITECNGLLDQMSGLDQYYKTVKPSLRPKIRGIKIEITTIKNSIINANQYRAEYSSHLENEAQKIKLGL